MVELTPYYTVVEPNGSKNFKVRFYENSFTHREEFSFDGPDGDTWICSKLDDANHLIYGELMSDSLRRSYESYLGRELEEDPIFYYVESGV